MIARTVSELIASWYAKGEKEFLSAYPDPVLVGVGILLSIIFTRMGVLDAPSAYLGTSPGAMSALIVLAFESGSSATLVVCFHFFRVVFVILTAPLFLKFFS